jgi:hypothetical protein
MFVLLDFGYEGARSKEMMSFLFKTAFKCYADCTKFKLTLFFSRKPYNKTAEYLSCFTVLCVLSHHVDSSETRDDELSLATQAQIVLRSGRNDFERTSHYGGIYTIC